MNIIIKTSSIQGIRESNEDEIINYSNNKYKIFAILDGHGGDNVSKYLKLNLVKKFEKKFNNRYTNINILECFKLLNKDLQKKVSKSNDSGSTCNMCIIKGNKIKIVNLGD